MCSANRTWIDRVETRALARATPDATIGTIYNACGEVFSATPLLGIAAVLLGRRLPPMAQSAKLSGLAGEMLRQADGSQPIDRFSVLCSDWNGVATAATLTAIGERPALQ
jgi:hypothetical protein